SFGKKCHFLLVDNSPSWLAKAYSILHTRKNTSFALLKKENDAYVGLDYLVGKNEVHHVVSANTVHLIPDIEETFVGIYQSLVPGGTFTFQSGNIKHQQPEGSMMIEDSVHRIHDLAIKIIKTDPKFAKYKRLLLSVLRKKACSESLCFPILGQLA